MLPPGLTRCVCMGDRIPVAFLNLLKVNPCFIKLFSRMTPGHIRINPGRYIFMETQLEFLNARGWREYIHRWSWIPLLPVFTWSRGIVKVGPPEMDLFNCFAICAEEIICYHRIHWKRGNVEAVRHIREL